jgi:hypothetical protein
MSDYGFKTSDDNRATVLNAKNPIFGFDMQHKPRAFKTFHIVDTKTSPIHTGSVAVPNPQPTNSWGYAQNMDYGIIRELIAQVKHGYPFRPVGYATISGTMKYSFNVHFDQTQRAGSYGGNYSKNLTKTKGQTDYILVPNMSGIPYAAITGSGIFTPSVTLTEQDFSGTLWPYDYPKQVMTLMAFGPTYAPELASESGIPKCIEVEIDDEYIYFYRSYAWSDTIRRAKFTYNGSTSQDIQERVKIAEQYTGSEYNVTVYLCPFPIEELLTSTKRIP